MFFYTKDIVWTVSGIASEELAISLNASFAEQAMKCTYNQESFEKAVWFKMGFTSKLPTQFIHFKQGILPQVFHCNTGGGVWLNLSELAFHGPEYAVIYYTHNADFAVDQLWFIRAFRAWAEAAKFAMEQTVA